MKWLIRIIWLIDIMDINFVLNGVELAPLLDTGLPINALFWLLYWLLLD